MNKLSLFLSLIILSLILVSKPSFSQEISPAAAKEYLEANPELMKKYISPEGKPTSDGARLLKTHPVAGALTPAEINEGLEKLKEKKPETVSAEEAQSSKDIEPFDEEKKEEILKPEISKTFPDDFHVFGQQLFSTGSASFTPPSNMPVSTNYIIGPDDNIVVQLWGRINERYTLTVQRDGSIQFPNIGTIQVAGITYKQLQDRIKREAESITGVNVNVAMGKLRSITIFVVGTVKKPGAYTVSAFDTILNALIYAGGPNALGSMRNIQLKRRNKIVTIFDLYDLILKGNSSKDMRLEPGDIIFVPKAETIVAIRGDVKAPAIYELKKEKSLLNALKLAGGIKPSAYSEQIQIQRYLENKERIILDMSFDELKKEKISFTLQDGDVVRIFPVIKKDTNAVYLFGNVTRSGKYEHFSGMKISDIIKIDELKPETYFPYALIKRYNPPEMSAELIPFDLEIALLKHDIKENIRLHPEDEIHIFSKWAFEDKPDVTVSGEVRNHGTYPCEKNMRIKDAILAAGDLTNEAYLEKGEIVRVSKKKEYKTIYFDVAKVMADDPAANLLLQDKDRIMIHSIWEEVYEKNVFIDGDVKNPGKYQYTEKMTVKDFVFKAGNLLESAFLDDMEIASKVVEPGKAVKLKRKNINLRKAIEGDPAHNLTLRPYDRLFVKRIPNWRESKFVNISGEVRFPGKYLVKMKEKLSSVLERAGGYTDQSYLKGGFFARKSVQILQQKSLEEMVDRLQRDIITHGASNATTALSVEEVEAMKVALEQKQKFVESLRKVKATGRMSIKLAHLRLLKGSEYDIVLEDGDTLHIPKINNVVTVTGAVMSYGSYIYSEKLNCKDYINMTGGYSTFADEDNVFVLKTDGSAKKIKKFVNWNPFRSRWEVAVFGEKIREIEPGDTIIVPEKVDRIAWLREVRDITQVLMQMAVTAGVTIKLF